MLARLGIADWDVLMVGDGSGCGWDIGCGWATAVVDRASGGRKLLWGGWSTGTVTIAELMPYVHALAWYENVCGERTRAARNKAVLAVHVISDSQTVVHQGNHTAGRHKLLPWWACWAGYLRAGYTARFHHVRREQVGLNVLCDHVGRCARLAAQGVAAGAPAAVYDVNPG